jgi:BNR/Asp-box repeat
MAGKRSVFSATRGKPGSQSNIECTVHASGANSKLDCDDPYPNNEPDIEVDPTNPMHMIASSNDYGTCCDEFYTSFDGGQTWKTGNMSNEGPKATGSDPVTVFDTKHNTAIHSSLNYHIVGTQVCKGDLTVSLSTDGGLTWEAPVVVDQGVGCDNAPLQKFNDKEWIVTDNNPASPYYGRTYLTWTAFYSAKGSYLSSPILEAHSDDGGYTWSAAKPISGTNAAKCTYQTSGAAGRCDENQFSVPTVGPDGTVYVAFENGQNKALWEKGDQFEDQYMVVKSTNGGRSFSNPRFVAGLEDGTNDYPLNADDRQTLSGFQMRVNSAGNIVADPNTGTLYLVFSDNRAGGHDPATGAPTTDTNIYMKTSTDGGNTWSALTPVDTSAGDQWFPWVEVNPTDGSIGVIYNDESPRHTYDVSLSQGAPGALTKTTITTASSHPNQSLYFQAEVPNCETCTVFHGDYINLSYGSDGAANLVWTDMRDLDPSSGLYQQFIYYARM